MDNLTISKLKDFILKNQDIAVVVTANPSLDQMAAGLGLYLTLIQMGKNVTIASPTAATVALSSLVGIDKVQHSIGTSGGTGDLVVSFPYREGEIDKVSYNLDETQSRLNIVVKAGEKGLHFDKNEVVFQQQGNMPTLVFYVGVTNPSDLGTLFITDPNVSIINIDNNVANPQYGTLPIVDGRWSSVSEQIADFVTLLEPQVAVGRDAAQNLLAGISYATQDFTSNTTSYLAFEVAGILMKKGAKRDIAHQIVNASGSMNGVPTNSEFFPPAASPVVPQPVAQPIPQPMPQPQFVPQAPTSPAASFGTNQPVMQQPQQPIQQEPQTVEAQQVSAVPQTPPDWLTPKVYKGSTLL